MLQSSTAVCLVVVAFKLEKFPLVVGKESNNHLKHITELREEGDISLLVKWA